MNECCYSQEGSTLLTADTIREDTYVKETLLIVKLELY